MTTEKQLPAAVTTNKAKAFRDLSTGIAGSLLKEWVGDARASEATGRIASALAASAANARKPADFYACTPQSVGAVVAIAALTGIMPSTGASALAYAVPRRPRKEEEPQLTYQLSHRGLNALARRCGQTMIAIPIGVDDSINVDHGGEISVIHRDPDNPPTDWEDLRGILLVVKQLNDGLVIFRGWVPKKILHSRRAMSDSYNYALKNKHVQKSDPWHRWPVEMAQKSAMHYAVSRGWCVIDDTEAVRALSVDQESDTVIEQVPERPAPKSIKQLTPAFEPVPEVAEVNEPSEPVKEISSKGIPEDFVEETKKMLALCKCTQDCQDVREEMQSRAAEEDHFDWLHAMVDFKLTQFVEVTQ